MRLAIGTLAFDVTRLHRVSVDYNPYPVDYSGKDMMEFHIVKGDVTTEKIKNDMSVETLLRFRRINFNVYRHKPKVGL